MIEVDVFWSFAIGAALASHCPAGIKKANCMFVNKYFVYTVCFLSMLFAPSGIYLLWHHTGWETMFLLDKDMHGIWPTIFAHTNVSLGVLGFCLVYKMIKADMEDWVHSVWTLAYTCMFGILSFGYDRFLYAGTSEDWKNGVKYELTDFFSSDVFWALLVMGVFVIPPVYYSAIYWPREHGGITRDQKRKRKSLIIGAFVKQSLFVAAVFSALFYLGYLPDGWGWDRLMAFGIGQLVLGSSVVYPTFLIRSARPKTK